MKFLKELVQLTEATEQQPVDVIDIVKNFPSKHKDALRALWGKDRLTFKGLSIFGSGGVYDQLDSVIHRAVDNGDFQGVEVYIESDEFKDDTVVVDYNDDSNPAGVGQEVYMGFSPSKNTLFVAYDSSLDEEMFNEEWDRAWTKTYGRAVEFDYDDPEHYKVFSSVWKQWRNARPFAIFELDVHDNKLTFVEDVNVGDQLGGFYSRGLNQLRSQVRDLVDLRLD